MKETVAAALSGGVDSLMAAALLKDQGFDVFGIHFSTGFGGDPGKRELTRLAGQLHIPIHFLDLSASFRKQVVGYFASSYAAGRTPNPCLVCNPEIKFGLVLNYCKSLGATRLATGHYAKVRREVDGNFHLYRGKDSAKDQSYFLSRLTQDHLSQALFPLAEWTKREVKALSKKRGFVPATSGESQDVCFTQGSSYGEFLASLPGFSPKTGRIQDRRGKILGRHRGLHLFTVGQRRGINCPDAEPYYVLALEGDTGRLIVGKEAETFSASCTVEDIRWIVSAPSDGICAKTRIRYRHQAAPSRIRLTGPDTAFVEFENPQKAVTPGQGAVFYRGEEVLGGGWIAETPASGSGGP